MADEIAKILGIATGLAHWRLAAPMLSLQRNIKLVVEINASQLADKQIPHSAIC